MSEGTQVMTGGNGVAGANEMSEDLNNTFTNNSIPSPNAPYNPSTGVDEAGGIPKTFELAQNYPNPFNPTTIIRFGVPVQSSVSIKVINILGQEVVTLVNDVKSPGFYNVQWEGNNQLGLKVASGVYFYRIEATASDKSNSFVSLKKMLLLK